MKRFYKIGLTIFTLLLFSTASFSAETFTQTFYASGYGPNVAILSCAITTHTDGTLEEKAIETPYMNYLKEGGFKLVAVEYYFGTTGALDNSDIYVENTEDYDVLGGMGVDQADNATDHVFYPESEASDPVSPYVIDTLSIDVRNNDVNSATMTINLIFERGIGPR